MHSPADGGVVTAAGGRRVAVEWALRAVALAALALLAWHASRPVHAEHRVRVADARALESWRDSMSAGDTLVLALGAAPSPATRDGLAALAAAGRDVRWVDRGVATIAATVEAPRGPDATPTLLVAAPMGTVVALGDTAGTLDSLPSTRGIVALAVAGSGHALRARTAGTEARASARESLDVRRVLVIGRAGWEAKFIVAALEEAGWTVDADIDVAPGARVTQVAASAPSTRAVPDTAHHAAVVVLDSSAAAPATRAAAIVAFVRAGGGAVLASDAANASAFATLRAGRPGARVAGEAGALVTASARRGLPLHPMSPLADAVVLERRGTAVAAAARRVGAGRVVQLGYDDSWRWRMEGDDEAPAAHRRWWSTVVASVARAPVAARVPAGAFVLARDAAPRAALVAALGAPIVMSAPPLPPGPGVRLPDSLLYAVATLALLAEWASRRLRGVR